MTALAGLSCGPQFVLADTVFTPYAGETIEHDSNIFDLPSSSASPVGKHGPTFADTFFETRAGADGAYYFDQNKLFGTAEFRRFEYDNFTSLNHNEELLDGELLWKLNHVLDGYVEYKHEQRMVLFQDLTASTALILETENNANAVFNVTFTPEWRVETHLTDHELDSPRVEVPELSLHEDSVLEGLKYLGVANLTAGLEAQYLEGHYSHDPTALNPDYHQTSLAMAATYVISGLTNFSGNVGYTKRVDPTNDGLSGVTGSISYLRNLTGKTSVNLQLTRALNTYLTTAGNELDTTAAVTVNWQATYKMSVRAGYSFTDSKFPQQPDGATDIERVDHYETANFEVVYQVLHWLSIHPYVRYQTRHTNVPIYAYNSNIVGVELIAKQLRPNR